MNYDNWKTTDKSFEQVGPRYEQLTLRCEWCHRIVRARVDIDKVNPDFWFCDECVHGDMPVRMDDWEGGGSW